MPVVKAGKEKPSIGRPKDSSKHAAILEAGACLFLRHGMSGTTMDEIAQTAGVSKLTVYNHFGTKEQLFQTVIKEKCEQHTGADLFQQFNGMDLKNELIKIGRAFISLIFSEDSLSMHRIIISESSKNPIISTLFYEAGPASLKKRFADYLEHVEKVGEYMFPDKIQAASLFFSLFKGDLYLKALLQVSPNPSDSEFDQLAYDNTLFFMKAFKSE